VARVIVSWGYEVERRVGAASYRVDVGVRQAGDGSRFILGVECDGPTYHSSRVARDRDRLRQDVLTGLGWRLHRVWSPSWYRDRRREEARLREVLERAEADPPAIARRREEAAPAAEVAAVELDRAPAWAVPYRTAQPTPPPYRFEMHLPEAEADLRRMVLEVVEVEAPVHTELALKRIRRAWGAGRAGPRIVEAFGRQLEELERAGHVRLEGAFIWASAGEPASVRVPAGDPETARRPEQVPPQEIDLALAGFASEAIAASAGDLAEATTQLFGWRRRSPDALAAVEAGVERLRRAGRLAGARDRLRWAPPKA
jgi:very-short-patch-repair endonuclease